MTYKLDFNTKLTRILNCKNNDHYHCKYPIYIDTYDQ